MTFTLGIFELFTYAVPGAMQLGVFLYLALRLDLVQPTDLAAVPGLLLAVALAVASYLLGYLTYTVGILVDKAYTKRKDGMDAWAAVAADAAQVGDRRVPRMNPSLLLAGVELRDREVAQEVGRFRATGLMLRGAVVPSFLGMLVALGEAVTGPHHWLGGAVAVLLGGAVLAFARHGQELRFWANTKTYQLAYWLELPAGEPETAAPAQDAAVRE
ncbi:hypothetical protein AB0B66_26375 [Catellatospora sp. NPDC049111]|uniref:hypothetical protein n=1 Tax=Catellatospora sp. NPDC049111 TaxID=3155271 RepID=UPI0033D97A65